MSFSKKFIKSRNAYQVSFDIAQELIPTQEEIRLLGDFNDWNWDKAPTLLLSKGTFSTVIELPAGSTQEFRYKCLNGAWYNDDKADAYVPSPLDNVHNCVVVLPAVEVSSATVNVKATPAPQATPKSTKKSATAKVAKSAVKAPTSDLKVDYTKIEGIGPKIADLIKEAGYQTYEDLAKAKKKDLQTILSNAGSRYAMHDPSTWAKQSKLLAQGKLEELKILQDELKGGKVV